MNAPEKNPEKHPETENKREEILRDLYKQRRNRIIVMSLLLLTLLITVIYGTLENPFLYTLSNIGNFFNYRYIFILWAIVTGICIQASCVALYKLENFRHKRSYTFIVYASVFLILTAVIPALKDRFPFWHYVHTFTAFYYALFLILSLQPFTHHISRETPRLKTFIRNWEYVILGGSFLAIIIFRKSGIFEIWFIITITLFLLYLSIALYEEHIVKKKCSTSTE